MNYRFAYVIAAALTLSAGSRAVISASSVRQSAATVEILVDGAPQPRYPHGGRWYVEARKGREYAIRLRNPYPVRVDVALSATPHYIDAQIDAADAEMVLDRTNRQLTVQTSQTRHGASNSRPGALVRSGPRKTFKLGMISRCS